MFQRVCHRFPDPSAALFAARARASNMGALWAAVLAATSLLWPARAEAHPSGLPTLKAQADFVIDTAWDWLAWDFHESIVIGTVGLAVLYTLAVTVWRKRYGWHDKPVDRADVGLFAGTLALMYFSLDGPLHHLADELLFSAHMLQHMILQLLWAPMLILSVPPWLWRAIALHPRVRPAAAWLSRPAVAFVLYNGVVFGWHVPQAYNLALTVHEWHIVQHLMFMSTAVIMWWVVLCPVEELRRPHASRIGYIMINMMAMKALGLMISLSDDVLYTFYLAQPRAWGITALSDQQMGGMLMWLPGGTFLWMGMGRVFYHWVRAGTPPRGMTGIPELDRARALRQAARTATAAGAAAAPEPEPANG